MGTVLGSSLVLTHTVVEHARADDVIAVVQLMKVFLSDSGKKMVFDGEYVRSCLLNAILDERQIVLLAKQDGTIAGVLVGVLLPALSAPGCVAFERVFFVAPDRRGRAGPKLLEHFEEWARARGAEMIGMAGFSDSSVSAFYKRRGYTACETIFRKDL